MAQPPSQPRAYSQAYLPNGAGSAQPSGPVPGARPLDPNQGRVQQVGHARVLCIADVRGNLRQLNELARNAKADYIIHTGDFGFYDDTSIERIAEKTLRHVAQYSPLLPEPIKQDIARGGPQASVKERFQRERLPLSELPAFLNKTYRLEIPVFTVWGACEDVSVLEKLRSQEYKIDNLHVIDESHTRLLDIGGVKLRLLGLGGAVVMHKLFDNGEGRTTIAGGMGTMWTTLLQIGELIDTATRCYDRTETRILVTHASPAREGLLNQLSVALQADFSISAGLHFRYGSSYNEFSVNPSLDHYRGKLSASKASFYDVWETVKHEVEPAVSENEAQSKLLQYAIDLVSKMPSVASGGNPFGGGPANGQVDESAFKNMWNFNLADAAFGWLVLDIDQGRIGTEMRAQGFNFSHRGGKAPQRPAAVGSQSSNAPIPVSSNAPQQPQAAQQQIRGPGGAPPGQQPPQQSGQQPAAAQQMQQVAQPKPIAPQQAPTPTQPAQKPPPSSAQPATAALTANGVTAPTANLPTNEPKTNGTSDTSRGPPSTPQAQAQPQEPSKGIFISNASLLTSQDDVKTLFASEDVDKITNIDRIGNDRWVAQFSSHEQMSDVLRKGVQKEAQEKFKNVRMAPYRSRGTGGFRGTDRGGFGNAGHWGRSGTTPRGGGEGRGGYQSTGGATTGSDSESAGRGRGAHSARGRGTFRGDRARGRGGRGNDRGGKSEGGATPTPAATADAS